MISATLMVSCSIQKFIPEGELLYTGASLEIESDTLIKNEEELKTVLEEVLRPTPNKKFLGMYPKLYFYYKNQQEKPGFINKLLFKNAGEKPVYLSDVKTFQIEELLRNRLENRGFYYNKAASYTTEDDKKKRASATYTLKISSPYVLETYQLDTVASPIYEDLKELVTDSKFKKGMRYDLNALQLERERIDSKLKQKGYYNFNPNFLLFEADTNQYKNKRFDLFLTIKKDVPQKAIVPYTVSKVNVYSNYDLQNDSLQKESVRYENKNFVNDNDFFKPKYLDPFITLEEGDLYNPITSKNTARRLSTIGAYKFVNIQYEEVDSMSTDSTRNLEASIYLSPLNKRSIRAELQAVTKSNNFAGPALGFTFNNRNLYKGGESLNISANIGYEVQIASGTNAGLSSLELSLKSSLILPRLIAPIKIDSDVFEYTIPKTKIGVGAEFLNRSQLYTLLSGTGQFGYIWTANKYVTHEVYPISINYTELSNTTTEFDDILAENPFLQRSFEQQFISGLTYSFIYNGLVSKKKNKFYINSTVDIAGNSISLLGQTQEGSTRKTFLGAEYAQYAKVDADIRYHFNLGNEQKIATRLFAGYGFAYGNSDVLPFIKQYFSGGPYSVRSFRIRSLGPGTFSGGSTNNGTFFDQTGNIRLEANVEYRFPIFRYVKGAVFADAGNIWLSKENEALPGGKFTSNFINELGIGAGIGLRVDIQGFVIRFDLAAPFQDPTAPEGERFEFKVDEPVLNFAIGYPF
ncbi:BamA/TamA family outer membrane protein [Dokdonia ponticola]|uniref:BamA/TamA family outer membrane protein n=1 Tax=Dokdonia ponticola TaxID=2041041 RepID=A0ABV9I2F3_9FLAO